jgi:hypothetical protein
MLLEKKNIKKQAVELVRPRSEDGPRKATSKNFGMLPTWKTNKGKTSKFVDAGGYNKNERAGNWRLGMGPVDWLE